MEKAEEIMYREVPLVEKSKGIQYIINVLSDSKTGSVVVTEKGRPIGIITESDMVKAIAKKKKPCLKDKIEDLMSKDMVTISKDTRLSQIREIMGNRHHRHLPVISDGRVVGIVSSKEISAHSHHINAKNVKFMRYQNIQSAIIIVFFIILLAIFIYSYI